MRTRQTMAFVITVSNLKTGSYSPNATIILLRWAPLSLPHTVSRMLRYITVSFNIEVLKMQFNIVDIGNKASYNYLIKQHTNKNAKSGINTPFLINEL